MEEQHCNLVKCLSMFVIVIRSAVRHGGRWRHTLPSGHISESADAITVAGTVAVTPHDSCEPRSRRRGTSGFISWMKLRNTKPLRVRCWQYKARTEGDGFSVGDPRVPRHCLPLTLLPQKFWVRAQWNLRQPHIGVPPFRAGGLPA